MWRRVFPVVLLLAFAVGTRAQSSQLTIENPKNLPVDEVQVKLLYTMICQEVAEALHVRDYKNLQYPLTLILGEEYERYLVDHKTGAGTIYLEKWDEVHFAASAAMLALHHALSDEQFSAVVTRSLRRFSSTRPISVADAKKRR
jgi:hypothetical protein